MDTENSDLEAKCEHMMNIVVESRKRFGKMCINYEQKTSVIENKILNYQIETFFNYKIKPKHPIPAFHSEGLEDLDMFTAEMKQRARRIDDLKKKIKNTQQVVFQLKSDAIGKRHRVPLTVDNLLARAESKNA